MPNTTYLLALLAIAFAAPAHSQGPAPGSWKTGKPEQAKSYGGEQKSAKDQRGTNAAPLMVKVLPTPQTQAESTQQARERQEKTANDRKLVEFTGWLVIATLMLAAIALLQAGVFGLQARRLRQTVETMGKTERRSLRAYVGVKGLRFECLNIDDPNFVPDFTTPGVRQDDFIAVTVENFGQTPARDVCVFTYFAGTEGAARLPEHFFAAHDVDVIPLEEVRRTLARFQLFPGQLETAKSAIDVRDVRMGKAGTHTIYVYGRIYYRDIYGRPWRTKFCYSWEPDHPHGQRFVPYEEYSGQDQQELVTPPAPRRAPQT
jgi:hypothetical protein